ncbi:MAG: Ribosomal RNA small subunit methyltransferase E [Chloroflexi bacterium]|nr:Ribosomal RNA small subunit methyltransferase E [Chloroflexota bacterium]
MRRFFVDPKCIKDRKAELRGSDASHLYNVLRLKDGDLIELFDGGGRVYQAQINSGGRDQVNLTLLGVDDAPPAGLSISLGQAMLKNKKMELIVQKCTELGVKSIHPFISSHSKAAAPDQEKIRRWQRIILESCKQCNQPYPPACHPAHPLTDILTGASTGASAGATDFDLRLICWEKPEAPPLRQVVEKTFNPDSILVLTGPEGGFSSGEIKLARAAGFLPVGLGPRILRAETAAIVIIALLQYIFNDLQSTGHLE